MDHEPSHDAARAALQESGLRATRQRIAVLAALSDTSGDATAQQLHEQLARHDVDLGLATVYRTLGALVEAGVVDSLQHGASTCYRWCAPGHHHHLTCTSCHAVVELHDCAVDEWAADVGRRHGFSDVRHVVELQGTCERCRAS